MTNERVNELIGQALSLEELRDLRWKVNVRISELERESGLTPHEAWQFKLTVKIVSDEGGGQLVGA